MHLFVIGAGGHGKVIADTALSLNKFSKLSFLDDKILVGKKIIGIGVDGKADNLFLSKVNIESSQAIVAVGNSFEREKLYSLLRSFNIPIATLIHPSACVSRFSEVKEGSVILAGSIVGADSKIEEGVIINHSSTVDHDCIVRKYVHLCPNSSIGGNVQIGDNSILGIGSKVIPGVKIGSNCYIGAGSVVIKDIPNGLRVAGVPTKEIQ